VASPAGQFHPWRLITTFLVIVIGLYALVFFTPGSNTPKLGIDLQGGTRITLKARTSDGSAPSRDSMNQARDIMERRVNGSGVAGAQVQVDGADQLVITVPGQENNLADLTRSAQLNIRPLAGDSCPTNSKSIPTCAWTSPDLAAALSSAAATQTTGTAATGTATGSTTGTSPAGSGSGQTPATAAPGTTGASSPATTPATTSAATTSASPQGLRRPAAATDTTGTTASGTATTGTGSTAASSTATTGTSTTPSTGTATTGTSTTPSTGTATTGTGGTATSTSAPPMSAFPAGSDPKVPIQPAAKDASGWAAWVTAAEAYATSGGGPTCAQINYYAGLDDPKRPLLACDSSGTVYLLEATLVAGTEISDATSGFDTQNGQGWIVNVTFKSGGFSTWSSYTTNNVGTQTAFTLDGEVLSAPVIQQPITTATTTVSGSFTQQSAKALADSLKFGALPLSFEPQESEQVSAELGFQYLKAGLIAGGIGLALVVLYCLIYYRLLGVITILSLMLSGALVYAVMVLLGRWIGLSLDMAGIAGLIIAIGITADSFVVYFERIKDEVREGRTFRSAVPRGWPRARRTILSADAVSFLSAAILYLLAVGDVKGFAFTLGLSTVLDLVIVFLVTHPLVVLASGAKVFTSPLMSGLGKVAKAGSEHRAATARLAAKEA
jgi:preprotein translocase subunit SecD